MSGNFPSRSKSSREDAQQFVPPDEQHTRMFARQVAAQNLPPNVSTQGRAQFISEFADFLVFATDLTARLLNSGRLTLDDLNSSTSSEDNEDNLDDNKD